MTDSPFVKSLENLLSRVTEDTMNHHKMLMDLLEHVRGDHISEGNLCDMGFFCREIAKLFDEMKKEFAAKQELIGKVLAGRVVARCANNPKEDPTVRGRFASGTAEAKMEATLPKRGTEGYVELCSFLGIDDEAIAAGFVNIHYPRFSEFITERLANEEPLPPGLVKTHTQFRTIYRKRK